MSEARAYTLSQLTNAIGNVIARAEGLRQVWITAETADVRVNGGHCYLELIEKDDDGRQVARCRATIWANVYYAMAHKFLQETGQQFRSDLKVMVCVTPSFHSVYGLSLNIQAINSAYTLGDALQRRAEMIERLRKDGIIDMNRSLTWPTVPLRIAVISGRTAAGYGDFINQLYNNQWCLRFQSTLYEATVQGERAPASIIAALEAIYARADEYDGVVIIRGGGATSDLACFDNYDLAAHIAQFPLPVIIGIGHERDITLLDYVANMRVKTPTAAAEWLIGRGEGALGRLQYTATQILQAVSDRLKGCHQQLAFYAGQLPAIAMSAVDRAERRLVNARVVLSGVADRRLRPEMARLDGYQTTLTHAVEYATKRERQRLDALGQLISALSPEATLRRGYTITRIDGHAVTSVSDVSDGAIIETTLADGVITSKKITPQSL